MKKVYLLLRNNHQSGPYSIDELKQQHLLSTDLVWIEGQSNAWRYPSEIDGVGKSPGNSPERSVRSGRASRPSAPKDEIEERAEELRKRAMSYTYTYPRFQQPVMVDEDNRGSSYLSRERELEIIYHKQPRSGQSYSASQLVAAGLITAMLAAGWYGRDSLFQHKTQTVSATVSPFIHVPAPRSAPAKAKAVIPQDTAAIAPVTPQQNTTVPSRKIKATTQPALTSEAQLAMATPVNAEPEMATPKKEEERKPEPSIKQPSVTPPAEAETKKESAEPEAKTEAKEEKRKTLGQAIKGIFKKKKKDKEEEE